MSLKEKKLPPVKARHKASKREVFFQSWISKTECEVKLPGQVMEYKMQAEHLECSRDGINWGPLVMFYPYPEEFPKPLVMRKHR